jgi:hypothetical protein
MMSYDELVELAGLCSRNSRVPSRYPTPMRSLSGNHDRILNPEPSRGVAAKRQPHDCRLVWKELPGLSSFLHKT